MDPRSQAKAALQQTLRAMLDSAGGEMPTVELYAMLTAMGFTERQIDRARTWLCTRAVRRGWAWHTVSNARAAELGLSSRGVIEQPAQSVDWEGAK